MGRAIKHPAPDRVKKLFVSFDIGAERQSARMSKITNDGLAQDALWLYPYDNSGRRRVKHASSDEN